MPRMKTTEYGTLPNFLASADYVSFSGTISQLRGEAVEGFPGKLIVPGGSLYPNQGDPRGLVLETVDVTDGDTLCAVLVRGYVYINRLPAPIAPQLQYSLQEQGIIFVDDNRMPVIIEKPDLEAPQFAMYTAHGDEAGYYTVTAELNETGKIYFIMIAAAGAVAPTAAQVKAGVNYGAMTVLKKATGSTVLDKKFAMDAGDYIGYIVGQDVAGLFSGVADLPVTVVAPDPA